MTENKIEKISQPNSDTASTTGDTISLSKTLLIFDFDDTLLYKVFRLLFLALQRYLRLQTFFRTDQPLSFQRNWRTWTKLARTIFQASKQWLWYIDSFQCWFKVDKKLSAAFPARIQGLYPRQWNKNLFC